MARPHAERVALAQTAALTLEDLGLGMHSGVMVVFGDAPAIEEAPLDVARIEALIERLLPAIPHARQRVRSIPVEGRWVWTDDERFNLHYHVRHSALPRPGDERQLKRLVGRLMSERLDRNRPLWEAWVIEGVTNARFALVLKLHAGVLEGAAVPELLEAIEDLDCAAELPPLSPWRACPAPSGADLLASAAAYWSEKPREVLERTSDLLGDPLEAIRSARGLPGVAYELLRQAARGEPRTALNPRRIGAHRRVELLTLCACEVERIAHALSAPSADVVLATLAGGLSAYLRDRGDKPEGPALQSLVSLPVELGAAPGAETLQVGLPFGMADPAERVIEVGRARLAAETSPRTTAHELLEHLESWVPPRLQRALQLATRRSGIHLSVDFLAAPRVPALLGAQAQGVSLFAPLHMDQGLSVGIVTGPRQLSFGFNSDWDLLPDLHQLVKATESAFAQLRART